jgi:hypothetical protein
MSMAAAAAPYVTWMNGSAAQAEETANQARAAAAAYETAFAATVPPPVIEAPGDTQLGGNGRDGGAVDHQPAQHIPGTAPRRRWSVELPAYRDSG